ncbi:MAG TPA: polysaccharide deacetylase, partial [Afipia sp.]|nr:polysaccharide deacetylase [Afipia sp.]
MVEKTSTPKEKQIVPISAAVADASSNQKNQLGSRKGKSLEVPSHGRYGYSAIVNRP